MSIIKLSIWVIIINILAYNTEIISNSKLRETKTTYINNRRYLGNKYKLLPFIKSTIEENCSDINSVIDVFAGTGAVASAFIDKKL